MDIRAHIFVVLLVVVIGAAVSLVVWSRQPVLSVARAGGLKFEDARDDNKPCQSFDWPRPESIERKDDPLLVADYVAAFSTPAEFGWVNSFEGDETSFHRTTVISQNEKIWTVKHQSHVKNRWRRTNELECPIVRSLAENLSKLLQVNTAAGPAGTAVIYCSPFIPTSTTFYARGSDPSPYVSKTWGNESVPATPVAIRKARAILRTCWGESRDPDIEFQEHEPLPDDDGWMSHLPREQVRTQR